MSNQFKNTHTYKGTFKTHYRVTSLNPVPNAQVCVYLTVRIIKLQLQTDENINIVIEFNPYVPKFSNQKLTRPIGIFKLY
jgi:hypothetical protein